MTKKRGYLMTTQSDIKAQEQIEIIRQSGIEERTAKLAAGIKDFEHQDNFVRLEFKAGTDINKITQILESLGVTDIINKYTNGVTKSETSPVFILNYQYSQQKKTLDNLEHEFVRMSALQKLFNYGGFKLSHAEQEYFDEQSARAAAAKMASKTK